MGSVINFELLETQCDDMKRSFWNAEPFEHLVVDEFCFGAKLRNALDSVPDALKAGHNKSNDYIFARNKFEKADFDMLSPEFEQLKADLLSSRFSSWLSSLTDEEIFVDPNFHGGGLHQGGKGSFLDMHADFNFHPEEPSWFRNVNVLLYLNESWEAIYGGQLKLLDGRTQGGNTALIEPLFNRAVIMFTREHTLHGYDAIDFPEGKYRTSIAAYGYTETGAKGKVRTTVWRPESGTPVKKFLGRHMPTLVTIKARFFGSGTTKNK